MAPKQIIDRQHYPIDRRQPAAFRWDTPRAAAAPPTSHANERLRTRKDARRLPTYAVIGSGLLNGAENATLSDRTLRAGTT
ncbi:hypothetical protein SPHINGO391_510189 [Sphingomonas aurantiaca]|uniref:Uncharacterized protein n=1 Tax=Sphingomonas aurantiaca TaxID=185949 RepID=A0A5E8AJQ1_9SPHN|nr:hypothetical protein SPHINGO391_510189 [Sphingomonas aurantiaca]